MESIRKSPVELKLLDFCETLFAPMGYRPVDVDCNLGGYSTVRVFVDVEPKEREITVEDCAKISQVLSPALDTETFLPGAYNLEVSSPGLDRRLRLRSDFESSIGATVKLRLYSAVPQLGSNIRGILKAVGEDGVTVTVDSKDVTVTMQNIKRGNIVWEG